MPFALLYHDVAPAELARHLDALARSTPDGPRLVNERLWHLGWMLTFDGGAAALESAACLLEARRWRGHFFVTADRIGTPGFLDAAQLRSLRRRGHQIGSHAPRPSACSGEELDREWCKSKEALSAILGFSVVTASVPGWAYSRAAAESASRAGYRVLFTAEPTAKTWLVEHCRVVGRYSVHRGAPAATAAALASGRRLPRWRQAALWRLKQAAGFLFRPGTRS